MRVISILLVVIGVALTWYAMHMLTASAFRFEHTSVTGFIKDDLFQLCTMGHTERAAVCQRAFSD